MIIQLIDDDDGSVMFSASLGNLEGDWDIFLDSETDLLVETIRDYINSVSEARNTTDGEEE